jgi:hypothetical protein
VARTSVGDQLGPTCADSDAWEPTTLSEGPFRRLRLAEQAPDDVQDVDRRERLVVGLGAARVVVRPEPERLHRRHPEPLRAQHVRVAAVPHEDRLRRVDAQPLERGLENERVRLSLPDLRREDGDVEALREAHPREVVVQEPAGVLRVRDEAELQAAVAERVEECVAGRPVLERRFPRGVLGGEEAIDLRVSQLDAELAEELPDHARVLDLLERVGRPEQRQVALPEPRSRHLGRRKAVAADRREPGRPARLEEVLVVGEVEERVAPVEKDGVRHEVRG